ncbi:MAG TPA: glutamate 5-kinase [Alphaproteobacteria bacterium]|nr:glutamate 5-kinase [Alphaproteobacteria bacterium]
MQSHALQHLQTSRRLVIKIGSALLCDITNGTIKQSWINALSDDIHVLIQKKIEVVVVSSGGIAMGRKALGIGPKQSPSSIPLPLKQAASAVGQPIMYDAYVAAFARHELQTAQVLLTLSETENRRMHLNARETLNTLLGRGIVPIINENDSISTEEIRFGDNDRLAVRVAQMVEADTVLLLSTISGFYSANPDTNADARHFPLVEKITDDHKNMAGEALAGLSTGGMRSKVLAAESAMNSGISLIIADGREDGALGHLLEKPEVRATLFRAESAMQNARKRWLGGHLKPKGALVIDAGAATALRSGKSLLPVGVRYIEGDFARGDMLAIKDEAGRELGRGLSAYDAPEAEKLIGQPSSAIPAILGYSGREEFIHRNDMVLNA